MGTTLEQPCYTLINRPTDVEQVSELQLKMDLEKGDINTKIEALKTTIHMIVSGERLPGILMTIIRFVLPLQDHMIKKLLLIFWEIVPKVRILYFASIARKLPFFFDMMHCFPDKSRWEINAGNDFGVRCLQKGLAAPK